MPKSKFFRVAVEGATVDGRVIERNWLTEMAASYNPATYAARVNMEHIRGITADKPFKAYGDVLSLKAEEIDLELDGKTQKRMALFAEIAPTDELVAMNRDKQKLFTSIEVNPQFAGTQKAYLVGLAVTDSPASLGTEALTFAVKNPGAFRNAPQLQAEGNVFSPGLETKFELADGEPAPAMSDEAKGFFSAATAFFKNLTAPTPPAPTPPAPPVGEQQPPANDNDPRFTAIVNGMEQMSKGIAALSTSIDSRFSAIDAKVASLSTSIETTDPNPQQRTRSTGPSGTAQFATDC